MTPRESRVWSVFIKKTGFMATCTACHRDYSYRASVSNLSKHWKNKHGKPSDLSDSSTDASDGEQEKNDTNKKPVATWKFFEVADSEKFEATCKICDKVVSYESVSDLRTHVEGHGEMGKESEDEYNMPSAQRRHVIKYARSSKRHSKLWKYFKIVDDKMATCLVCHGVFNYASTITNLRRHLMKKHQELDLSQDDEGKKMIVSANGQLYEVETAPSQEDNDDDKLPMEMDTIYLEDLEDPIDERPPSSKKKQPNMTFQRDSSAEYLQMDNSKEPFETDFTKYQFKPDLSREQIKKVCLKEERKRRNPKEQFNYSKRFKRDYSKERFQREYSKERRQREYSEEQVKKNSDTCSEYSVLPRPQTSTCTATTGSIDYFGQYVVSLLKELPKPVSDKLQNDIINQILTNKMALHSQTMAAKCELAVNRNNETETELSVPEPVSFAIIQSNEDTEKANNATECLPQE